MIVEPIFQPGDILQPANNAWGHLVRDYGLVLVECLHCDNASLGRRLRFRVIVIDKTKPNYNKRRYLPGDEDSDGLTLGFD